MDMRTLLAFFLTAGLTAGCILPIPISHGKILEGAEVKTAELGFLQPEVTTNAEVIKRLGQPAILWRDENTLVYRWVQRKGMVLWAIGGYGAGAIGATDITAEFAFLIRFDPADRFVVSETVRISGGKPFGEFLLNWRDAQRNKTSELKEAKP